MLTVFMLETAGGTARRRHAKPLGVIVGYRDRQSVEVLLVGSPLDPQQRHPGDVVICDAHDLELAR